MFDWTLAVEAFAAGAFAALTFDIFTVMLFGVFRQVRDAVGLGRPL
jgi:hypothetical protein